MSVITNIGLAVLSAAGGVAALGIGGNARDANRANNAWNRLKALADPRPKRFEPAMVVGLPEVAQRYFLKAIEEGTPLHRVVELKMEGSFLMNGLSFPMTADQVIAPPHGLVWRARMGKGVRRFAGSDGYLAGETSWTRFWLLGIVPLARAGGTSDHARAAAARMAMESIWVPAALLAQNGVVWRALGEDRAEVRFPEIPGIEPVVFDFDSEGRIVEVMTMRWTNANPEKVFRLQPFGGRMLRHASHQGFHIPVEVEVGNMYGTPDYNPFFRARITAAHFCECEGGAE